MRPSHHLYLFVTKHVDHAACCSDEPACCAVCLMLQSSDTRCPLRQQRCTLLQMFSQGGWSHSLFLAVHAGNWLHTKRLRQPTQRSSAPRSLCILISDSASPEGQLEGIRGIRVMMEPVGLGRVLGRGWTFSFEQKLIGIVAQTLSFWG